MSEVYTNCIGKMCDGGDRMTYDHDGAMREPSTGKGRYDLVSPFAMQRIALWYELGSQKYAPRNWEKGIPFGRCIDSAKRHIDKFLMGKTDEDHLAAACWNIMAIMHYQMLGMDEFDDIPKYNVRKGSSDSLEVKAADTEHKTGVEDIVFENKEDAFAAAGALNYIIDEFSEMIGLCSKDSILASTMHPIIVPTMNGYHIKFPDIKGIRDIVENAKYKEENK